MLTQGPTVPTRYWHKLDSGRVQCDLCPRFCKLLEGQRGLCFVRAREKDAIVLTTYGRSSGFCLDPIEKKPLNHFLPGTPVLSFGTAGCNLACKFCQNWDISKSREVETLAEVKRCVAPGGRFVVLPVAMLMGRGILDRLMALVFRVTGQVPQDPIHVFTEKFKQPFVEAGFQVEIKGLDVKSSLLLIVIATKPN